MRSFKFESIWLLSHGTRKARRVDFHPSRNLIQGPNHTGKSSLVKNIFITLGATPAGELEQWDPHTVSVVQFRLEEKVYRAVHHNGARALFDEADKLIWIADSHAVWTELFADLIGFNLTLTDRRTGKGLRADPASFFLPFYIDQDGSWTERWDTFPSLIRFKQPVGNILDFFSGIKPAEYYQLKSQQGVLSKEVDTRIGEIKLLDRAKKRLINTLPIGSVNFSEADFQTEIRSLSVEANKLNTAQENLRLKYVREAEFVADVQRQIDVAYAALRDYTKDRKYLNNLAASPELICPTCGAAHEEPFLHFLGYAEDARILEELARGLKIELATAQKELITTGGELQALSGNYARINHILEKKSGELQFKEVVESQGAHAAHRAFNSEREQINKELTEWTSKLNAVSMQLNELTDKKRAKRILGEFRDAYAAARVALKVSEPKGRLNLLSRPKRSGSGGPRLLLAYYAALWKICHSDQVGLSIPVVIDSPNQQDQDDVNLHIVLAFIADSLPQSMQLIVCVTKDSDAVLDKRIFFDKEYSMLDNEFYDKVESEIGHLYQQMNARLITEPAQLSLDGFGELSNS